MNFAALLDAKTRIEYSFNIKIDKTQFRTLNYVYIHTHIQIGLYTYTEIHSYIKRILHKNKRLMNLISLYSVKTCINAHMTE